MDFDKLIEDYKSPETFDVTLPGGEVFTLVGGFGGAAEGGVRLGGLSGRRREGEKERRGE